MGKRKRWGFSIRIDGMLILHQQRGLGTHLTMSKIQELHCVGACGKGPWKKACRTADKQLFQQGIFWQPLKGLPSYGKLKVLLFWEKEHICWPVYDCICLHLNRIQSATITFRLEETRVNTGRCYAWENTILETCMNWRAVVVNLTLWEKCQVDEEEFCYESTSFKQHFSAKFPGANG